MTYWMGFRWSGRGSAKLAFTASATRPAVCASKLLPKRNDGQRDRRRSSLRAHMRSSERGLLSSAGGPPD